MKRLSLLLLITIVAAGTCLAQNKKAEKEAAAIARFEVAKAALDSKDFVIIVKSYEPESGIPEANTDQAVFFSLEKEYAFLQGSIIADNNYTNKLVVTDYKQTTDKKGNIRISMQIRNSFITAKVEITLLYKADSADVILTPSRGMVKRFSGEVVAREKSKYFKRATGVE